MPKISDEHRNRRQQQILDGARRSFAQNGFERTTIRHLESATGLSSGAIFNYYASKLDIFIALAAQDAQRMAEFWRAGGMLGLVQGIRAHGAEMSASYLELGRRIWSDPNFREKWQTRGEPLVDAIREGLTAAAEHGSARSDIPVESLVDYTLVVLDGLMLHVRLGLVGDELTTVLDLYETTIAGPPTSHPNVR